MSCTGTATTTGFPTSRSAGPRSATRRSRNTSTACGGRNPDFLYSVSRDFIKNCQTPILVLPDDTPSHPLQTSIDVASLAPNSEITVFPWREPEELRQRIINKVRNFLKSHLPMRAAAQ